MESPAKRTRVSSSPLTPRYDTQLVFAGFSTLDDCSWNPGRSRKTLSSPTKASRSRVVSALNELITAAAKEPSAMEHVADLRATLAQPDVKLIVQSYPSEEDGAESGLLERPPLVHAIVMKAPVAVLNALVSAGASLTQGKAHLLLHGSCRAWMSCAWSMEQKAQMGCRRCTWPLPPPRVRQHRREGNGAWHC